MIRKLALPGTFRRVHFALFTLAFSSIHACAQFPPPANDAQLLGGKERERQWSLAEPLHETSQEPHPQVASSQLKPQWSYGGFVDLGYLLDFNHPSNHLFRNRGTTRRVNELDLNMAAIYLTKET